MGARYVMVVTGATLLLATAAWSASPATPLPPGPGHDLVAKDCAGCHELSMVTATPRTPQGWSQIVEQMIAQGATVGDDEKPKIIAYLAKNFPAGAKTAPAAAKGAAKARR